MKKVILLTVLTVFGLTLFLGCASAPPLRTEASTSGIRAAEEAGAAKVPQASLHLQLAKEELELAKRLSAKGEKEKAASMLLRAEADAELAVVLSHEDAEKAEAMAAVKRVRQLRQDNP
jgi:regulator of protease activity HflC (stomatin/prohibitin superfamily)